MLAPELETAKHIAELLAPYVDERAAPDLSMFKDYAACEGGGLMGGEFTKSELEAADAVRRLFAGAGGKRYAYFMVSRSTMQRIGHDLDQMPYLPRTFVDGLAARTAERFGLGESADDRRRLRNARKRARKAVA